MKQTIVTLTVALLLLFGSSVDAHGSFTPSVRIVGQPVGKKKCHTITKKAHGKKIKVKACKTVKPVPIPTVSPNALGVVPHPDR